MASLTGNSPSPIPNSGPTLNFQKSQDLVMKNPKIEQKFPSIVKNENRRKR